MKDDQLVMLVFGALILGSTLLLHRLLVECVWLEGEAAQAKREAASLRLALAGLERKAAD